MTSNQLGASTILQPLPNSLGKNQCKFDFLSYFVLLLILPFQFNLQLPSDLGDLFIVFGLLLIASAMTPIMAWLRQCSSDGVDNPLVLSS